MEKRSVKTEPCSSVMPGEPIWEGGLGSLTTAEGCLQHEGGVARRLGMGARKAWTVG